jgi:hypothetical protein
VAAKTRKTNNIEKRRRLSELYVKGKDVHFNEGGVVADGDEADDDIVVWVQPPDPFQREEAIRSAQAAKARARITAKEPDSQTALEVEELLSELDESDLCEFLVDQMVGELRPRAIRDVLGREEWEDFTALQDSMREWEEAGYPETDEWAPLIARDKAYGEQIQDRMKEIMDDTRESLKLLPEEEIKKRVRKRVIDQASNQAFMQAYEINMLYYSCRDDEDHSELFFENIEEIRSHEPVVQQGLADALSSFINDPAEAKNSPRVDPGSESSEPPAEPEISESSTPQEATV